MPKGHSFFRTCSTIKWDLIEGNSPIGTCNTESFIVVEVARKPLTTHDHRDTGPVGYLQPLQRKAMAM